MKPIRVGTRGSRLAVAQTEIALAALRKTHPGVSFEIVTISTKGDVDKRPLFTMDEKGIFEKEVNDAVKKGDVDFAVHSLKDIPSDLSEDLAVACIPKRASPNDVLVNDTLSQAVSFTAPRGTNERSWLYRIRPSVKHHQRFSRFELPLWKSAPDQGDRIFLHGLAVECIIGFIEWERRVKQTVVIDVEMPVDCARAAQTRLHDRSAGDEAHHQGDDL